ncbi:MAG: pyridoxal-phosphate dependent enzyme [Pseudomonadota bacterium]
MASTASLSNSTAVSPPPALAPNVSSVLDLIGNTPMVRIRCFDTGPCELYVKMESQNPGASIKDRIALSMIEAAERDGKLKPGGTIIEATAGNTGLGLALVAASKGYRMVLIVPDKMAREKVHNLAALGAEVITTRSDVAKGHPEYYQDMAARIAKETPGAFYIDQFNNAANPLAHEQTTGPEILEQMDGRVDAVVCGVGSGGTITGLSRYFAERSPSTEMVLADPEGSILVEYVKHGTLGEPGSWAVEGIGEDFIPGIADLSRVAAAYTITDKESFETARTLLRRESILAGSSAGTLVAAAVRYCQDQTTPKRVVTFICDTGAKYLSKMFNDTWMIEQGYLDRPRHGDLRDLITRPFTSGATVTVGPEDTLLTAYRRMRSSDVTSLPVIEGERIVGLLDETDLLLAVRNGRDQGEEDPFAHHVSHAMITRLETVGIDTPVSSLPDIFDRGRIAIVMDGENFVGLLTAVDLLNHLRLGAQE